MSESMKTILRCVLPLLVFLITTLQVRPIQSQINSYGDPPYCLFSRVEEFNCNFRVSRTPRAQANQFAKYSTRVRTGNAGRPTCGIRNRDFRIRDIPILGEDEKVKYIFSPGRRLEPPQNYGNQIYVMYNISCPPNHLAFFNLTEIDLEEPNCFNVNFNQTQCVDYVRVIRPGFGNTESCGGATTEDNLNQLEQGTLSILFRTSDRQTRSGFQATVICFDPETRDQEGCTRPVNGTVSIDEMTGGRRRRDLEDFHQMWKRHLVHLRRRRRRQTSRRIRFETINVPFGVDVLYRNRQLTFELRDGGMEFREPIRDILILNTFDRNGTIMSFARRAGRDGTTILALGGPGPLKIVGNYAYFQLFVIDPRGIQPTPEEMVVISNLTQAQYALITEDNGTRLTEEMLNPPCIDPVRDLNLPPIPGVTLSPECVRRGKRQVPETMMLEDSAIRTAIMNENACNPVLRTSAQATIQLVEMNDPDLLAELRASIATTAPPVTTTTEGLITPTITT